SSRATTTIPITSLGSKSRPGVRGVGRRVVRFMVFLLLSRRYGAGRARTGPTAALRSVSFERVRERLQELGVGLDALVRVGVSGHVDDVALDDGSDLGQCLRVLEDVS